MRYDYDVFADYHQITLEDCDGGMPKGDDSPERANQIGEAVSALLNPEAFARHLGVYRGVICILTARNTDVPLVVELHATAPQENLSEWDHVVEASIETPSGCLVVSGGAGMFECRPAMHVAPGTYRVRVCFGAVYTISDDGMEGEDRYRVVLWPSPAADTVVVHTTGDDAW